MVVSRRYAVLLAALRLIVAWRGPGALQSLAAPPALHGHNPTPPPPANHVPYVTVGQGLAVQGPFDPVRVAGTLKVAPRLTGLADGGSRLEAEKVEPRPGG